MLAATGDFLPHAVCYLWDPNLLALHAVTDTLIGVSYVAISATLAYLVYRTRSHIPFHWMILAFGTFIVACGLTHFMEVWTLWQPRYWLAGGVKFLTAVASVATALMLPPLVPQAAALVRTAKLAGDRDKTLRASEARFRALVESAPDAMIISDQRGQIQLVNGQAETLFGYRRDELIGAPVEMLLPDNVRAAHAGHRARYHADPRTRPMGLGLSLSGRRKDGTEFPAEISLSPLTTEEGLLVTAVVRDMTERRRAEEQRLALIREQAARAEAEAANRMKDEFLATLSHELRTPLNAVYGWARMLGSGQVDPTTLTRGLAVIERNARVQVQMIEELLDVSRIVSGKMRLELRPVRLRPVIEAALDAVRPAAEAKQIRLETDLDDDTGPVTADADRLQQVVWNLLSNSVKFTPRHGRVDVSLHRLNSRVEIAVTDTGEGIDLALLPHIFERFKQGDSTATRHHGGLGIGLALVRHLVELHGGEVRAQSEGRDKGATFTVSLPLSPLRGEPAREPATTGARPEPRVARSLDGLRILVIDDDRDSVELVREVLAAHGARVDAAASADEARERLASALPDVLICDIEMPGEDGLRFMRAYRSSGARQDLPAVALTAYGRVEDRVRILASGFNVHLAKPVEPTDLVAAVATLARGASG